MSPTFSAINIRDGAGVYVNLSRYRSLRSSVFKHFSNLEHHRLVQHCVGVSRSFFESVFRPLLLYPVSGILTVCAKEEVIWSYARRVIAPVKNIKILGNGAVMNRPRDARGARALALFSNVHHSVAVLIGASSPFPAVAFRPLAGVLIYSAQETDKQWYLRSSHDMGLLNRFKDWIGSFGVQPSFEPFVF